MSRTTTALARKNVKEVITIDFDNAKIVAPLISRKVAMIRETVEILSEGARACNDSVSTHIPFLWGNEIKKASRIRNKEPEAPDNGAPFQQQMAAP